jgi:hypothetical protein
MKLELTCVFQVEVDNGDVEVDSLNLHVPLTEVAIHSGADHIKNYRVIGYETTFVHELK